LKDLPFLCFDAIAMPVIFVHGVSVRAEGFATLLRRVDKGITFERKRAPVIGFYWGDMGASLSHGGASIPGFLPPGARSFDLEEVAGEIVSTGASDEVTTFLLDDPYLELRTLSDSEEFNAEGAGFMPSPEQVLIRNQFLASRQARVTAALRTDPELIAAVPSDNVSNSVARIVEQAFSMAGRTDRTLSVGDLIDPLRRCIMAALYRATVPPSKMLDPQYNWHSVGMRCQQVLEHELGGHRGAVGARLREIGLSGATVALRHGLRRRIMQATSLFVGDVMVYVGRRALVIDKLDKCVADATTAETGPVWLVGHSLGGVICYDYCCVTGRKVDRLVTVGSQVGLFAEFGTLAKPALNHGKKFYTPNNVDSWVNIYDPNDMLSFLAASIFNRVVDIEVNTHAPFPISHSEYWNRPEVYKQINKFL
jgi:hypothetical protein